MSVTHPAAIRDEVCNLIVDKLDAGTFDFLNGAGTVVISCPLNATAFGASAAGTALLNVGVPVIGTAGAGAGDTVVKGVLRTAGTLDIIQCSVGLASAPLEDRDVEISSVVFADSDQINITTLSYTVMP